MPKTIAVASGKGGTGKTTIATNLAYVAASKGQKVAYLDCDVEEPNGHIFLKPKISNIEPVGVLVPEIDDEKCTYCGKCGEICQYSAVVCVNKKVLVYPELCHSCGGCKLVCPSNAITEVFRKTGQLNHGKAGLIYFVDGSLDIGEAMSPPIIREVKSVVSKDVGIIDIVVLDAPPGTSCPVVQSIHNSDFVILVTEPTPFGMNDLALAVEMVKVLGYPFGVVINRVGIGNEDVYKYCHENGVRILLEIPDDKKVAEMYSQGVLASAVLPEYRKLFDELLEVTLNCVNQV